ncbi:MAG: AmmeMemoRadiSam system radical SAM enzyme [Rhodospirillaceae bacterium]
MAAAFRARYWHALADGRLQCDLCPRRCRLGEGQQGLCFVRERRDDVVILSAYGRSSGFCVDPIEKKPLNHFLPGSAVLSFGTAGCNLTCKFCQNWDISKSRQTDTLSDRAAPETIARAAHRLGCASVAFTYNDPVIFHEYAVDVAAACHTLGIRTVAVTAGYVCAEPRAAFYRHIDAANVDLKGFSERFYRSLCSAELGVVLDTLSYLRHETSVWLEITTLLIPGENDSPAELEAECRWIVDRLGPDVPLHFSAFHPDYKLTDRPPTPHATLIRARGIARAAGIRHVYLGNVDDPERSSSWCSGCGARLIERRGYALSAWALSAAGACQGCGTPLPGVYAPQPGRWGNRRLPVRLAEFEEQTRDQGAGQATPGCP